MDMTDKRLALIRHHNEQRILARDVANEELLKLGQPLVGYPPMVVEVRELLAEVDRLGECEWQDDVPLARLYTLRQALGLTTDCPIDEGMWEADIARNRALLDATLAYGAARESRVAEGRRLRAANYQGNTAEGAAYRALLVAEAEAQDALHAAYAAYAGPGEER